MYFFIFGWGVGEGGTFHQVGLISDWTHWTVMVAFFCLSKATKFYNFTFCSVPILIIWHWFWLQALHGRHTNNQRGSQADTPDTDSKPSGGSKENHISSGPNGTEETGQPIPRKRQSRGNRKAHSSRKQRFFAGNFISNPDQYGGVSESPPGNSVGYFYGSTPENHR